MQGKIFKLFDEMNNEVGTLWCSEYGISDEAIEKHFKDYYIEDCEPNNFEPEAGSFADYLGEHFPDYVKFEEIFIANISCE